jgi:hypothetical protein
MERYKKIKFKTTLQRESKERLLRHFVPRNDRGSDEIATGLKCKPLDFVEEQSAMTARGIVSSQKELTRLRRGTERNDGERGCTINFLSRLLLFAKYAKICNTMKGKIPWKTFHSCSRRNLENAA